MKYNLVDKPYVGMYSTHVETRSRIPPRMYYLRKAVLFRLQLNMSNAQYFTCSSL